MLGLRSPHAVPGGRIPRPVSPFHHRDEIERKHRKARLRPVEHQAEVSTLANFNGTANADLQK